MRLTTVFYLIMGLSEIISPNSLVSMEILLTFTMKNKFVIFIIIALKLTVFLLVNIAIYFVFCQFSSLFTFCALPYYSVHS